MESGPQGRPPVRLPDTGSGSCEALLPPPRVSLTTASCRAMIVSQRIWLGECIPRERS